MNVKAPEKDGYDRASFWISVVLAGVGIAGVFVGIFTLGYLRKQAFEMRLQRKVMARSLGAMRQQGEIEKRTLLLQYRPKIVVRNARVLRTSFEPGKPWEFEIRFEIVNRGGSVAHVTADGYIQLVSAIAHDHGTIDMKWGDRSFVSNVTLQPGAAITIDESLPVGVPLDIPWENFNQGVREQPLRSIYFSGVIYYIDELQIPRSTGIHRRFEAASRDFIPIIESEQEYSD